MPSWNIYVKKTLLISYKFPGGQFRILTKIFRRRNKSEEKREKMRGRRKRSGKKGKIKGYMKGNGKYKCIICNCAHAQL
jgi:hypothetical protein